VAPPSAVAVIVNLYVCTMFLLFGTITLLSNSEAWLYTTGSMKVLPAEGLMVYVIGQFGSVVTKFGNENVGSSNSLRA
jgi:hypothetical protein